MVASSKFIPNKYNANSFGNNDLINENFDKVYKGNTFSKRVKHTVNVY